MSLIGQRVIADLRYRLYEQMQRQSLTFFTRNSTGVLMSRITNDVHSIQGAVSDAVTNLIKEPFTLIFLVGVIFYRDWQLAIIAMLVFPLTIYPIAKFGKKIRKVATRNQETMGDLNTLLQETISGARIVKAFCMETHENQRFAKVNEKLMRLAQKTVSISAMSSPFMEFLGGLGIAAVVLYGGYRVIQGHSTPGTFFSFLTAVIMLYQPIKHLTNINNTIQKGIAGAQRVFEIIDLEPDIVDRIDAFELDKIKDKIELRNVSFAYDETPILRNINLDISAGEVVAFVGMSGGGKTTLVNLIPRFYDVTSGQILIDGHDIREVTLLSLRRQIGIVTQQTILFNDTVRNNIAYGSHDCSEEDIMAAASAATAHDFNINLPEGYNTVIGELGTKLSGGERQRISIARPC
jgi:subfamily B ATP-binding cassette protein MsbA